MRLTFSGIPWIFRASRKLTATYGYCDYSNNTIVVDSRLAEKKRLEILLHEGMHACDAGQALAEEWVCASAKDLAEMLWKMGYRRT